MDITKKTVLFAGLDAMGHINSFISIANSLKRQGHRTVFLFDNPVDCGLSEAGHELYDCTCEGLVESKPKSKSYVVRKWDKEIGILDEMSRNSCSEKMIEWVKMFFNNLMQNVIDYNEIFARKLELINPDVMILDQTFIHPSILKSGKPWALIFSPAPLILHPVEHDLPPAFFGFSTENKIIRSSGQEASEHFRMIKPLFREKWAKYLEEEHQLKVDLCPESFVQSSPYLNVYIYPEELDYNKPLKKWIRCDSIMRNVTSHHCSDGPNDNANELTMTNRLTLQLPIEFRDKPGKLIYLSMGTLASANINLMKRLIGILSKSVHKYIVSTGPNSDQYELAPNMWGQKFVDQLSILPYIDLIITHGGNNTITECFYYGVPGFIVCPVFLDQMDNAQRIEECKLGKTINPYSCNEHDFLHAIEQILADHTIKDRMNVISKRMQLPENKYKAIRVFNEFVLNPKLLPKD